MKLIKPNFWYSKKSLFFPILLFPLTLIVMSIVKIKKIFKSRKFNIPIICVGNIYIGGTGKTPLAIYIAKELSKLKKKPVIVKKYYEDHHDEHSLIKKYSKNLILNLDRRAAILDAERKKFNVVILDDGFQDNKIEKDINIICFNKKQLIGNGFVIPSGPLRENLSAIKNSEIILINGGRDKEFEKRIIKFNKNALFIHSKYKLLNYNEFKNKNLLAFSGIGNPENFFELLIDNKLKIKKKIVFPDHYQFKKGELSNIIREAKKDNLQIVTTEKDFHRLKNFKFKAIKFAKIDIILNSKKKFFKKILKIC